MIDPTYSSALGKAGAATGFGLAQLLGGMLSAPREWLWDKMGLGKNGSEFVQNLFHGAVDPEGAAGTILGNGAEMLLDPLNLLGPLAGMAGKAVGRAADIGKAINVEKSMLTSQLERMGAEKAALGEVGGLAKGVSEAPQAMANWPRPTSELWRTPPDELFHPPIKTLADGREVIDAAMYPSKTFNRVSPDAMAALEQSGFGQAVQGKPNSALMTMSHTPNFVQGRGGVMQLDPTRMVPEYGATFSSPRTMAQMYGHDEAASLAQRLGASADLLDAPVGDLSGLIGNRMENLGLDEIVRNERLGVLNSAKPPINWTPPIDESQMNSAANAHVGGIAALLAPLLFRAPKPIPRPFQTEEPPLAYNARNPEMIGIMPDRATIAPPIFNR